jgi:hypothetical protein
MLVTGSLQTRWWKDNARECGLGYQAKSENVDNAGLATSYVVKYIAKNIGLEISVPRLRRINFSRKFPAAKAFTSDDRWTIIDKKTPINDIIEQAWYLNRYDVELHGKIVKELE